VQQAWVVVTLVQVFEDAGEYLGFFVRQIHLLHVGFEELAFQRSTEEGGQRQDILMSSKDSLITTHNQGDYGAGEMVSHRRTVEPLSHLHLRLITKRLLDRLDRLARTIL